MNINNNTGELELQFSIASKGGGYTDIQVCIGKGDFPEILNLIHVAAGDSLIPNYRIK